MHNNTNCGATIMKDEFKLELVQQGNSSFSVWVNGRVYIGEFYIETHGYYVWNPAGSGYLSSEMLRKISDKLDSLNKEHDDDLNSYFNTQEYLLSRDSWW